MFVLIYSNKDGNVKSLIAKKYYLPESIIKNYSAIVNRKNFHDQRTDSDIKRFYEIRKLTRQDEDYTTGY